MVTEMFDPRWRDHVSRAQQRNVFAHERMEGGTVGGFSRYMACRERYGEEEGFVDSKT